MPPHLDRTFKVERAFEIHAFQPTSYDTACITVQVFEPSFPPHGPPAANCYVEATGVSYSSVSSGYTDQNGVVCLVVKLNEQVSLQAFSTVNQTWVVRPR